MLNRRKLLGFLASLPFIGKLLPETKADQPVDQAGVEIVEFISKPRSPNTNNFLELVEQLDIFLNPSFIAFADIECVFTGCEEITNQSNATKQEKIYLLSWAKKFVNCVKEEAAKQSLQNILS